MNNPESNEPENLQEKPKNKAKNLDGNVNFAGLIAYLTKQPLWLLVIIFGIISSLYMIVNDVTMSRAFSAVNDKIQTTTDRFAEVIYTVKGEEKNISGVLTQETAQTVTVIVKDPVQIKIDSANIIKVSCEADSTGKNCPINSQVTLSRAGVTGILLEEKLGNYLIRTEVGDETIFKIALNSAAAKREPEKCDGSYDLSCSISVKFKDQLENPDLAELKSSELKGRLAVNDSTGITLQIVEAETKTIQKADIVETILYKPLNCAFNNLAACNEGTFLTVQITLWAFLFSMGIGLVFGLMRVSGNFILVNVATVYVEVVRGIPLIVILLFFAVAIEPWYHDNFNKFANDLILYTLIISGMIIAYFAITRWKQRRTDPEYFFQPLILAITLAVVGCGLIVLFNDRSQINDASSRQLQAAIIGLAVGYGAFLAELFRAGIQSISKGQMEAARSLGMTYVQAMRFVILPQAFRVILPPLGNDFIALLKDTSLVAILAIPELTQLGKIFATNSYLPFPTYIVVGVNYLMMTLFLSLFMRVVENRMSLPK